MAWTPPKTNWVDGEYFNLNPDYKRIKENIEYLITLSYEIYSEYDAPELESADIKGYPTVDFFNNVVRSTNALLGNCFSPDGAEQTRLYSSNGVGWNADELNTIENNHLLMYQVLHGQKSSIRKLQLTLGGVRFGN